MDYTKQPLTFKLRKAVRYSRLYGLRRTRAKARSYYHMNRRYEALPGIGHEEPNGRHVAIIGCGKYAYAQIAYYLRKNFGNVIWAAMDVDVHRAASLFEAYEAGYYTDDAERILADPAVDLVYVASNHASHAEYAIGALAAGKHVHIEKPHVVDEDQLRRLCNVMQRSSGRVALGFNRPQSSIGMTIASSLAQDRGPLMMNWFVAGHEIPPDHWYYSPEEGGRVLGNLCHWTDFVLRLVPAAARFPIEISPTRAESADSDIAVTYTFGDGSIAAITFSAKGHAFEGVKERFAAHRGDTLVTMDDFRTLEIDVGASKHRVRLRHRDHGHERSITKSYALTRGDERAACDAAYVWETGILFLETKRALEEEREITVQRFAASASQLAG